MLQRKRSHHEENHLTNDQLSMKHRWNSFLALCWFVYFVFKRGTQFMIQDEKDLCPFKKT